MRVCGTSAVTLPITGHQISAKFVAFASAMATPRKAATSDVMWLRAAAGFLWRKALLVRHDNLLRVTKVGSNWAATEGVVEPEHNDRANDRRRSYRPSNRNRLREPGQVWGYFAGRDP